MLRKNAVLVAEVPITHSGMTANVGVVPAIIKDGCGDIMPIEINIDSRLTISGRRFVDSWCRHYSDSEPPSTHSCDSRIALIGEAPGKREHEQGKPFCLQANTRVLTSRLGWVPIVNLEIGDKLLGIEEYAQLTGKGASKHGMRRWQIATVTRVVRSRRVCKKIYTTRGKLVATGDHKLLLGSGKGQTMVWRTVDSLYVHGSRKSSIVYTIDPVWPELSYEAGWLAGFLDGEGHILGTQLKKKTKRRGRLGFSQNSGVTAKRAVELFDYFGIKLNKHDEQRVNGVVCERHHIAGNLQDTLSALSRLRPERLIDNLQGILEHQPPYARDLDRAKVTEIEDAGEQDVVDITTTTGTFIAEGFVVHNCGPSGWVLEEEMWRPVGLRRADFYITNCYPFRPLNNDISTVPAQELDYWINELHKRIAQLADPWLIVPTGNTGLRALFNDPSLRITNLRGSILSYTDLHGRQIKVIPTIHPAASFRMPILKKLMKADWQRIAEDRLFRHMGLPRRVTQVVTYPTDLEPLYEALKAQRDPILAVDIECSKASKEMYCVGFAATPNEAYVVPWDPRLIPAINRLCVSDYPKVLQNGMFDQFMLAHHGISLNAYTWDLIEMDHALDPNDGGDTQSGDEGAISGDEQRISMHSLAVLTSLYTRQPYYKSEGKLWAGDRDRLYNYCGLDCMVTREIQPILKAKLIERGML